MGKTALAILSPGTEEMEIVITVDVLRRAGVSRRHFSYHLNLIHLIYLIYLSNILHFIYRNNQTV